ncbi:MAG TPA: threonine-phosphate decarboxylase, partial [Nitrospiraceae bacterium]|nr:threonine-phosphate decarboxylase [Nitrospiraceae bacterium]
IEPIDGSANFLFAKLTSTDAGELTHALGRRGILVRDCSSFPGLGNQYVRIAVRTRRENERLAHVLASVLAG